MKIVNIKHIKKNIYEITLEKGNPFLLLDETILHFHLLKGSNISNLKEILEYDLLMSTYISLVKKLNKKLMTEKEVKDYLTKESISNYSEIINKLKNVSLINDLSYIKSFINTKVNLTLDGPEKIKNELLKKGLKEEDILNYLNTIEESIWQEKVNKIISKKEKSNKKYSSKILYQNIKVYLTQQGYKNFNIVLTKNNNEETINKETIKLLKKYQRKNLNEKDINFKIKGELYKKGYTIDEIDSSLSRNI